MRKSIESLDGGGRGWGCTGGHRSLRVFSYRFSSVLTHMSSPLLALTGPPHTRSRPPEAEPAGSRFSLLKPSRSCFPSFTSALCAAGQDILYENKESGPSRTAPTLSLSLFVELKIYDGCSREEDACDVCARKKKYSRCGIWSLLCETVVSNDLWG